IGSLSGAGNVMLGTCALTVGGDNTSTFFSGALSGSSGLIKEGSGTWVLTGANTYTGPTLVNHGNLLVNTSQPGSDVVVGSDGLLGGTGTVGAVTVQGVVNPGVAGAGVLTGGPVTFAGGSAFQISLNGTNAGSDYNQLNVAGPVDLSGGPALLLALGFPS